MQRENKWQDRFDGKFPDLIKMTDGFTYQNVCSKTDVKSFIQSEIDIAVAEERSRVVEEIRSLESGYSYDHPQTKGFHNALNKIINLIK